jgi:hypothetical protein
MDLPSGTAAVRENDGSEMSETFDAYVLEEQGPAALRQLSVIEIGR